VSQTCSEERKNRIETERMTDLAHPFSGQRKAQVTTPTVVRSVTVDKLEIHAYDKKRLGAQQI